MASFGSLPTELVLRIFDFVPPQHHLDFALTSRRIASQAKDVFTHHRRCGDLYHTCRIAFADGSLQSLWRLVLDDPVAAWHVRTLVLHHAPQDGYLASDGDDDLRTRLEVEKVLERLWQWTIQEPALAPREPFTSGGQHMIVFDLRATGTPRRMIPSTRPTFEGDSSQATWTQANTCWADRSREHFDEVPLATRQVVILAAMCPRLNNFKTVQPLQDIDAEATWGVIPLLADLVDFVSSKWSDGPMTAMWPSGLASIQSMCLHGSDLTNSHLPQRMHVPAPIDSITRLRSLVSLRSLRLSSMGFDVLRGDEWRDYSCRADSKIQNLLLEQRSRTSLDEDSAMLTGGLQDLKHVVLRDYSRIGIESILKRLYDDNAHTLETFVYSGDIRPVNHSEEAGWTKLNRLRAIRTLTVDVLDMFPCGARRSIVERTYGHESHAEVTERFVSSLPTTLETIIFEHASHQRMNDAEMRRMGDAIIQLVEQRRCPGLVAIYADNFESDMRDKRSRWGMHTEGGWLSEARMRVRQLGVDMYTQDDVGATHAFIAGLCRRIEPQWVI